MRFGVSGIMDVGGKMRRFQRTILGALVLSASLAGCSVLGGLNVPIDPVADAGVAEPEPSPEREPQEDKDDPDDPLWDGGPVHDGGPLWNGRCEDAGIEVSCPLI